MTVRSLNLTDELWERLDLLAARESRSRSSMAALLLEDALQAWITDRAVTAGHVVRSEITKY